MKHTFFFITMVSRLNAYPPQIPSLSLIFDFIEAGAAKGLPPDYGSEYIFIASILYEIAFIKYTQLVKTNIQLIFLDDKYFTNITEINNS